MAESSGFRRLEEFLETCYDDDDLRSLARCAFGDTPEFYAALPGTGASLRSLARSIVMTMIRYYEVPPASLWDYLVATRAPRRREIQEIRGAFAPADEAIPVGGTSQEPISPLTCIETDCLWDRTIHRTEPANGQCDLLALVPLVLSASTSPPFPAGNRPFAHFVPGKTNGLPRAFLLDWKDIHLAVQATPTLYRGGERMGTHVDLPAPADGTELTYFPCGRHHLDPETGLALGYRFKIEAWNRRERTIRLIDPMKHRLTLCLLRPGDHRHEH